MTKVRCLFFDSCDASLNHMSMTEILLTRRLCKDWSELLSNLSVTAVCRHAWCSGMAIG